MAEHFGIGFRCRLLAVMLVVLAPLQAHAQEEADGAQLLLELRQLRTEVDFLRNQLETGGGVADVRFDDLQRRIDKVLDDAASLATQASTAQRRAEAAVRKVDGLERQVSVMQANIDTMATRLARIEEDALFNAGLEGEPLASADPTSKTDDAPAEGTAVEAAPSLQNLLDDDGTAVPLPKDRAETLPPAREVTVDIAIVAEEIASGDDRERPAPGLIAIEGAKPLVGEIPVLPLPRPGAPGRGGSTPTNAAPVDPQASSAITPPTEPFIEAKTAFEAGNYADAAAALILLIDANTLGAEEAEGFFLLGSALLRTEEFGASVQALAQGLRRFPDSPFAAPSLVNLADALTGNGQRDEACRLLSFVAIEYPGQAQAISDAQDRATAFGC